MVRLTNRYLGLLGALEHRNWDILNAPVSRSLIGLRPELERAQLENCEFLWEVGDLRQQVEQQGKEIGDGNPEDDDLKARQNEQRRERPTLGVDTS
jgi:hypothetical protein